MSSLNTSYFPLDHGYSRKALWWAYGISLILAVCSLLARPVIFPIETKILFTAWHQWLSEDFLPQNVPPLMFWIIMGLWKIFGVYEFLVRLINPFFAFLSIILMGRLMSYFCSNQADRYVGVNLTSLIFVGSTVFCIFSTLITYDFIILFFYLAAVICLIKELLHKNFYNMVLFGLSAGCAFLVGGLSSTISLLIILLLLPLISLKESSISQLISWYFKSFIGFCIGFNIILIWLIPLWISKQDLSWIWHIHFFSWYEAWDEIILILLAIIYPWFFWPILWDVFMRNRKNFFSDYRYKFAWLFLISSFSSLIFQEHINYFAFLLAPLVFFQTLLLQKKGDEQKEFHGLIPASVILFIGLVFFLLTIVPLAHLDVVWRKLIGPDGLPIWLDGISLLPGLFLLGGGYLISQMSPRHITHQTIQIALLPVLLVVTFSLEFLFPFSFSKFFDISPIAQHIHMMQDQGHKLAILGKYEGEFDFPGRLKKDLDKIDNVDQALVWATENPQGIIVTYFRGSPIFLPDNPLFLSAFGNNWIATWPSSIVLDQKGFVLKDKFSKPCLECDDDIGSQ
ncbi:MAG: hypothetical protein K1X44_06435 [Alphaproteobacteria bacterium]|nr:hypothetical protein [Alphaproteobacteria bacterium]